MASDHLRLQRALDDSQLTVTRFLETLVGEEVIAEVVHQSDDGTDTGDYLSVTGGEPLIHRFAVLKGRSTERPYLWAESIYAPSRLPEAVCAELAGTSEPIGRVLTRHGLRLDRTPLSSPDHTEKPPPDVVTQSQFDLVWSRSYRLEVGGIATFAIHEWWLRSVLEVLDRTSPGAPPSGLHA